MSDEVTSKTVVSRINSLRRTRTVAALYCLANLCVCFTQLWFYLQMRSIFFIVSAMGSGIFAYVQLMEARDANKKIKSYKLLWAMLKKKGK